MTREVYPNPPLRLVVTEVRYPFAPRLGSAEVLEELTTRFRPVFPIPEAAGVQMVATVGGVTHSSPGLANRFFSRSRTASVTITPINLIIETAAYGEYAKFRPVLQTCLDALSDARDGIVGVERIGLRFINEVRAPGLQDPREWATYLAAPFVAALDVLPGENIAVSQSVVQTMPHDDVITLVRFGTSKGQAVSSIGPLKVSEVSTDEPFFLLDFDNSWTSNETYDEYSVETVLALCDRLHEPIDQLFEAAITDSARELFRRQP